MCVYIHTLFLSFQYFLIEANLGQDHTQLQPGTNSPWPSPMKGTENRATKALLLKFKTSSPAL